jgi:hypothetical protein
MSHSDRITGLTKPPGATYRGMRVQKGLLSGQANTAGAACEFVCLGIINAFAL